MTAVPANLIARLPMPRRDLWRRHPWLGAALVSVLFTAIALGTSHHVGWAFRDPDGALGARMVYPFFLLVGFLVIDVLFRVGRLWRHEGTDWREALHTVSRQRLRPRQLGVVLIGFVSFHLTYLSYRNLKSYLPEVTNGVVYDRLLMDWDRLLFLGAVPAEVLHNVLGTGIAAHFLSSTYLVWLAFVPVSVAVALMWVSNLRHGYWYVTALVLNWILGTASYYVLPAMGPAFTDSRYFADLPATGVTQLQSWLVSTRVDTLADPIGFAHLQSAAAFASLHVSIVVTALLICRHLGHRRLTMAMWGFLACTALATIYFGWHYVLDDVAGVIIGWAAVVIAAYLTGSHERAPRLLRLPRLRRHSAVTDGPAA